MKQTFEDFQVFLKKDLKEEMKRTMDNPTPENYKRVKLIAKTAHYLCESKEYLMGEETTV